MITTRTIRLDEKSFSRLLLKVYLKRRTKLLYVAAWIILITYLFLLPTNGLTYLLLTALALFPLIFYFTLRRTARASENQSFIKPRSYTIEPGRITARFEDGSAIEEFEFYRPFKVIRTTDYYLLYISKVAFFYLPYDCFESAADRETFEREIVSAARSVKG